MIFVLDPAPVYMEQDQWQFLATAVLCAVFAIGTSLGLKL